MITIRGYHISCVRPSAPASCNVYKDERPYARRQARSKTIKEHCGRVVACAVLLKSGGIRSISMPTTHLQVIMEMVEDVNNIVKSGWLLDTGHYVWR